MLENSHKSMEADGQMCNAYGLDDREDHSASDQVSGRILTMRFIRADVELS